MPEEKPALMIKQKVNVSHLSYTEAIQNPCSITALPLTSDFIFSKTVNAYTEKDNSMSYFQTIISPPILLKLSQHRQSIKAEQYSHINQHPCLVSPLTSVQLGTSA